MVFQVIEYDANQYILATSSDGLFLFDPQTEKISAFKSDANDFMLKYKFWEGIKLAPDLDAMGSWDGGLVFANAQGNDLHVHDQTSGLIANHIYDLKLGLNNDLWLATSNGISHISLDSMNYFNDTDQQPTLTLPLIRHINFQIGEEITKTTLFVGAEFDDKEKNYAVFDRDLNIYSPPEALSIYFAAPQFAGGDVLYSVYMEGYDRNWSGWKEEAIKEYTNLPEGTYRFYLQAKKVNTNELSRINSFNLTSLLPGIMLPG